MKKHVRIEIDLNQPNESIWNQIEQAKKQINHKPWWKRIFCW